MINNKSQTTSPQLHEIPAREVAGRDTASRFEAQFRGAAMACLSILCPEDGTDRVYCDFHDDYVSRERVDGVSVYHFVQVKTKSSKKHQWNRLELFGLASNVPAQPKPTALAGPAKPATAAQIEKIKSSFVGRLLEHTARFTNSCGSVRFLTNTHLTDEVEDIVASIAKRDFNNRTLRYLSDNYAAINNMSHTPSQEDVEAAIAKLLLVPEVDYIDPSHIDFDAKAGKILFKYSEIDLSHIESRELANKLISLVRSKSSGKLLSRITEAELDDAAGIGIHDLLELLPVSKEAYFNFINSGDEKALKNSSILQRKLAQAGATPEIIETASLWKVEWDNWFRTQRHVYEDDFWFLQNEINSIYVRWAKGEISFAGLEGEINDLEKSISTKPISSILTRKVLLGGVLARLVKGETK